MYPNIHLRYLDRRYSVLMLLYAYLCGVSEPDT